MSLNSSTLFLLLALAAPLLSAQSPDEAPVTYQVRQTVTIDQIAKDAKSMRMWIAIPDDARDQEVLDLQVTQAPGTWRFVTDPEQGNRYLFVEGPATGAESVDVVVDFVLKRQPRYVAVDESKVGPITESLRRLMAAELRLDEPHLEVTPALALMAATVCGDKKNVAEQARLLLEHVAATADHYSKDRSKPSCGVGDAANCVANGGGCCTDLHSLFIALCRARGIPARLQMGYRLLEKNADKEVDPGYRCWVEYFIPGYGWVAADIVEADAATGTTRERWLTGLSARRLWLNQGRDFRLAQDQVVNRVNHMSIAYVEIDGRPARLLPVGDQKPQIHRKVMFSEIASVATKQPETVRSENR